MVWFGLAAAICGEDLFFKSYVKACVRENSEKKLIGDKVILTRVYNHGAMLGWMDDAPEMLRGLTMLGIGSLAGALAACESEKGHVCRKLGLSLMLGGAASNAWERVKHGKVTDYIRFNAGPEKFRRIVFNKGDFAVFAGSLLLIVGEMIHGK